jgi:hypothetical protein
VPSSTLWPQAKVKLPFSLMSREGACIYLYFYANRLPADIKREAEHHEVNAAYQAFRNTLGHKKVRKEEK